MAERLSALAAAYRRGTLGPIGAAGPGVTLAERSGLAILQVAAIGGEREAASRALAAATGAVCDGAPNRAASHGETSVLWIGPGRWLVVAGGAAAGELEGRLRAACPGAAVTAQGHGRTVLRLAGPHARDVLGKGSGIDFHARSFPPGSCAQGLLGHVGALFHAVDTRPTFDLYVARSFAQTVWEWLLESAAEYGVEITAAIA